MDGMIERGSGAIVNIASDAGRVGSSGEAVYSATKGGVIAFTKTLARELARAGVRVNCVCPGPTETALLGQLAEFSEKLYQDWREPSRSGEPPSPRTSLPQSPSSSARAPPTSPARRCPSAVASP